MPDDLVQPAMETFSHSLRASSPSRCPWNLQMVTEFANVCDFHPQLLKPLNLGEGEPPAYGPQQTACPQESLQRAGAQVCRYPGGAVSSGCVQRESGGHQLRTGPLQSRDPSFKSHISHLPTV